MERRKNKYFKHLKKNYLLVFLLFCGVLFLSVGFSAFWNQLSIDGASAVVRIDKDIRIMGVRVDSVYHGSSSYEDYNVSRIQSRVNLESEDAYVIYEVDVYHLGM